MSELKKRSPTDRVFLSAEWRWLAMLNWEVDPAILADHVPNGTELDFHEGKTFVSIVGFMFLKTRLLGIPVPFHRNFEELNLRFYVKREEQGDVRRGVAFISELVPRWAIATTARVGYNEAYRAVPMRHTIEGGASDSPIDVRYEWRAYDRWHSVQAASSEIARPLADRSIEQFIAEHYWGYSQQRNGTTFEYQVKHEPWNAWQTDDVTFDCDVDQMYGAEFAARLSQPPDSAFIADGSAVTVSFPRRLHA